ncbi:hypothetical protein ABN028_15005 [Actinopolymorpha sp. B17G11]|uniref:hypothetical protein n=1 Tax=Actinopolymorpha sp. B17G11 TaxID=3160861 RepID=UPI0032E4D623
MNTSTKIGAAVVGGYVLGRRKKAKMALLLGSVLVGKRLNVRSLGREAMGRIAESAQFGQIREEIRGELVSTGRSAAGAVLSAPLNKLADGLHQRTSKLTGAESEEPSPDGKSKRSAEDESEDTEGRTEGGGDEGKRDEREGDEGKRDEREGDEGDRGEDRGQQGEEREDEQRPRRRRPPTQPTRPKTRSAADRMSRTRGRRTPAGAGSRGDRD